MSRSGDEPSETPRAVDPDLWREAYELLSDLLPLDAAARQARLDSMVHDPELLSLLQQLLSADARQGPLDRSPGEVAAAVSTASEPTPDATVIGGWRLGPELGRGGMGLVYRATREGVDFEQRAALKLLQRGMLDQAGIARFQQEQQVLARLEHPNIAALIDGGVTADGTPFLVLQEVDGKPIDQACSDSRADARAVVELVLAVCDAIAYAHSNLVVHRDLKPANILVDGRGTVRLLDFGVAKLLDAESDNADTTRVLTPGYGAPEQTSGGNITTATDVYGIGAVLYRLLSGQSLTEAAAGQPQLSGGPKAVAGVDQDLQNIVSKALREEPTQRYVSAQALADDLRCWLAGQPVSATADRLAYRMRKLLRRHRLATAATVAVLLSLLVGSGLALWQAQEARQQATKAQAAASEAARQLEQAETVTNFLVSTFAAADPSARGGAEINAREILDEGSRRIENDLDAAPAARQALRSALGEVAYNLGDLQRAESMLARNIGIELDPAQATQAKLDQRVHDLRFAARVATKNGQHDLAQQRFAAAQVLAPRASSKERIDLQLFQCNSLLETRQSESAGQCLEQLLAQPWYPAAIPSQQLGTHYSLATAYNGMGRSEEAKHHAELASSLVKGSAEEGTIAGWPIHRQVELASIQGLLASIEADLGELDRAVELAQRSVELSQELLGPRHPTVLVRRNDLATLLRNQGRFEESASMLQALHADQLEVLGPQHPYLAYTHFNLGQALAGAADLSSSAAETQQQALGHYQQAVQQARLQPTTYGPVLAMFSAGYGQALAKAGQPTRAEQELRAATNHFAEGDDSPLRARIGTVYARFLNDRGRFGEAREQMEAAVPVLAQSYGEGSRHHALAQLELGRAQRDSAPEEAQSSLRAAIEALRSSPFHRQYAREIRTGEVALAQLP